MARLFLFAMLLAVFVAIVIILVSIWQRAALAGQRALRPMFGPNQEGQMAPTAFQKVAYAALIVLLFGVATGWLGGM